jgi:hypothetical protein
VNDFFKSKWVPRPPQAIELAPDRLPHGYRAAGVHAGIKERLAETTGPSPGPLDVGLLVSDAEATVSSVRRLR